MITYEITTTDNGYVLTTDDGEDQRSEVFEDDIQDVSRETALFKLILTLIEKEHPHNEHSQRNISVSFPPYDNRVNYDRSESFTPDPRD